MTKRAYVGVDGKARKVKKIYLGADGKARKVKKGYVGVGGVARPFFTSDELKYYGAITALSDGRMHLTATSVGGYAIFGGGTYNAVRASVDAYNASLVRSTPSPLSAARTSLAATSVGDHALFGGGFIRSEVVGNPSDNQHKDVASNAVDAYNASLVHSTLGPLGARRYSLAAASVGSYALFGGGFTYATGYGFTTYRTVDAYNTALVRSTPSNFAYGRGELAATATVGYALFGGGRSNESDNYANVDAYSTSLARSTPAGLSVARFGLAAASVGGYALFGGGNSRGYNYYDTVDAYNTALVKSAPSKLSDPRYELIATSVGGYALFGGGRRGTNHDSASLDAYNDSLTRSNPVGLSVARFGLTAASVGGYALFGGGSGGGRAVVDAYVAS